MKTSFGRFIKGSQLQATPCHPHSPTDPFSWVTDVNTWHRDPHLATLGKPALALPSLVVLGSGQRCETLEIVFKFVVSECQQPRGSVSPFHLLRWNPEVYMIRGVGVGVGVGLRRERGKNTARRIKFCPTNCPLASLLLRSLLLPRFRAIPPLFPVGDNGCTAGNEYTRIPSRHVPPTPSNKRAEVCLTLIFPPSKI